MGWDPQLMAHLAQKMTKKKKKLDTEQTFMIVVIILFLTGLLVMGFLAEIHRLNKEDRIIQCELFKIQQQYIVSHSGENVNYPWKDEALDFYYDLDCGEFIEEILEVAR